MLVEQRIAVVNAKGGVGKTTLAVNLATYYAIHNYSVVLVDTDLQNSAMTWLVRRGERKPALFGIDGVSRDWDLSRLAPLLSGGYRRVVVDSCAALHGDELGLLLSRVDCLVIPVLPSPLDIYATADFIGEIRLHPVYLERPLPIGVVGNRSHKEDAPFVHMRAFLDAMEIPLVASFDDSLSYVQAMVQGLSIHELPVTKSARHSKGWLQLVQWLSREPESG